VVVAVDRQRQAQVQTDHLTAVLVVLAGAVKVIGLVETLVFHQLLELQIRAAVAVTEALAVQVL
jgi:hypothetical protein